MENEKIRIVLVDDHQMIREALRHLLERAPGHEVVAEAGDGREIVNLVRETSPDIVCMDVDMPGMNGVETTRQVLAACPHVKVIALSALSEQPYVRDMIRAGASAYVTKNEALDELLRAISAVRRNRLYLCPEVAGVLTGTLVGRGDERPGRNVLAPRECEVLQRIATGCTSSQIAKELQITPSTVDAHRRNIMRKLELHSIAELTRYAIRNGIVSI